jgi:hypothetical protein
MSETVRERERERERIGNITFGIGLPKIDMCTCESKKVSRLYLPWPPFIVTGEIVF